MQLFLFLYAGTFTWRVSTAILLKSRRLAAATEIRMTGRAQTGFVPTAATALLEDAHQAQLVEDVAVLTSPPVPGDYFRYYYARYYVWRTGVTVGVTVGVAVGVAVGVNAHPDSAGR